MKRLAVALALLTAACGAQAGGKVAQPVVPVTDPGAAGDAAQDAAAAAGVRVDQPQPPEAPPAESTPGSVAALCTPASGVWSAEEGQTGLTPVKPRENSEVGIWECRTGMHRLVVKHEADLRGYHACSATLIGSVSAWVDGVKVLRSEPIGDYGQCIARVDEDITPILVSITLGRDGKLSVCRLKGRAYEEKKVCETVPHGGRRDPAYYPPGYRTKPALELRIDRSPVCRALTPRLMFLPPKASRDASLDAFAIPGTVDWGLHSRKAEASARFDIDNDGSEDAVSLVRPIRMHGGEWGGIAWRPGGKPMAEPFEASELPDNDQISWNTFSAYSVQPVRVDGRAYVYVRRRFVEGGPAQDLDAAADRPKLISRGLLELRPDGKVSTVCGWGPKVRPEERL